MYKEKIILFFVHHQSDVCYRVVTVYNDSNQLGSEHHHSSCLFTLV